MATKFDYNMTRIPESELVLNADGSVYHLNLQPEQIADTIITVGDPDRVERVSRYFDKVDTKVQKREFITHTGELNGKRLTVISTGIGTDNIDIVMNELDALVNIDLKTRMVKEKLSSLKLIRVGTSGCLQEQIPLDSLLISVYGLGLDGLMHYYDHYSNANETMLQHVFQRYTNQEISFPVRPYISEGSLDLVKSIGYDMLKGITVTCPGFYAPQGRQLRIPIEGKNILDKLGKFHYNGLDITNFEMETSALYGMARMMGHEAVSCNALIANRVTKEFSKQSKQTVQKLIEIVLERLTR